MKNELALLGRILELARDPAVRLEDFERSVAASPRLAAEVVRVANSALYGMEGRIHQLQRAVLILGVQSVSGIAVSILARRQLLGGELGALGDALWTHSLEVGVASQLIARCLGLPLEAEGYLVGLLHELGVLELRREHGTGYSALLARASRGEMPLERLELEAFAQTHAQRIGAEMTSWGFPELLRQAAEAHHTPESAPEGARPLAALVRAAHALAAGSSGGFCDAPPRDIAKESFEELGLYPDDVVDIQTELAQRMKALAALF